MFYDENGKHVRTKKEILGEDGEIREGCRIVKKGEVYEKKKLMNNAPLATIPGMNPYIAHL